MYHRGDEFDQQFERLNTLFPRHSKWKSTRAAKDHTDEFGDKITLGETYYLRNLGGAWDNALKLSKRSMDVVMFSFFANNSWLEKVGDQMIARELEEMKKALECLPGEPGKPPQEGA